jgi:hypothetical protein
MEVDGLYKGLLDWNHNPESEPFVAGHATFTVDAD